MDKTIPLTADQKKQLWQAKQQKAMSDDYLDMVYQVCYYYQQFAPEDVIEMTSGEIHQLLRVARREQIRNYRMLLDVASGSSSDKGYKAVNRHLVKSDRMLK